MGDDKIQELSAEKQPSGNAMIRIKEKFENLFTKKYESKTEILDDYFDFDSNGTRKLSQLELVVFQEKLGISCEELNKKYRITSDGILVEQTQDISSEDGKETNDSNDSGNADNIGDFVEDNGDKEVESTNEQQENTSTELPDTQLEPNSKYEIDGETYETDDSGKVSKKNGELLPNTEYTISQTVFDCHFSLVENRCHICNCNVNEHMTFSVRPAFVLHGKLCPVEQHHIKKFGGFG